MLWKPSPTDRSRSKTVSNPFHLPALPLTPTQAPGEGGPTRPSGGWRGGRKEVLRMSYWERRTSLLRCTFLCHLKSRRKENAAGVGRKKAALESLCEGITFLSASKRFRKGFLPFSERKQEPFRHDPLTCGLSSDGVNMGLEIIGGKFNVPILFIFGTNKQKKRSTRNLKICVAPTSHLCLTVTPGELKGRW